MTDAMTRAWGNPSSIHTEGRTARAVVEDARAEIGRLVDADPRDIVLTSGGTEANNLAIRSQCRGVVVASRLEHPSVARVCERLEAEGKARVRWLRVLPEGTIDLADLEDALGDADAKDALVAVQAVNHETGVIQPLEAVGALVKAHGARLHVDAIQAWGKIAVPPVWDSTSIAAHKFRGPKGIGALATRQGVRLEAIAQGGAQEKGIRPGTVDPALAAGFGCASRFARETPATWAAIAPLRDRLEAGLLRVGAEAAARRGGDGATPAAPSRAPRVVGTAARVPHVTNLVWPGWIGAELVAAVDLEGVDVSSGAACSAGTVEPSPVLAAMLEEGSGSLAASGVRASLGDLTTEDDVTRAIAAFERVLSR